MTRWETHVHTAEGSACGRVFGAEMACVCKQLGYDGMIVTDHFYHGNTAVSRDLPWESWVEQFCMGYRNARAQGEKIGLTVLFGWEYSWNGADFLTYGLTPEWLLAHPETIQVSPKAYLQMVRDAGALVVQAHPFRMAHYVDAIKLLPDCTDAVEVYNGGNTDIRFNERTQWYAESYGLPQVSGSDAHEIDRFSGGVLVDGILQMAEDYGKAVWEGRIVGLIRDGKDVPFGL